MENFMKELNDLLNLLEMGASLITFAFSVIFNIAKCIKRNKKIIAKKMEVWNVVSYIHIIARALIGIGVCAIPVEIFRFNIELFITYRSGICIQIKWLILLVIGWLLLLALREIFKQKQSKNEKAFYQICFLILSGFACWFFCSLMPVRWGGVNLLIGSIHSAAVYAFLEYVWQNGVLLKSRWTYVGYIHQYIVYMKKIVLFLWFGVCSYIPFLYIGVYELMKLLIVTYTLLHIIDILFLNYRYANDRYPVKVITADAELETEKTIKYKSKKRIEVHHKNSKRPTEVKLKDIQVIEYTKPMSYYYRKNKDSYECLFENGKVMQVIDYSAVCKGRWKRLVTIDGENETVYFFPKSHIKSIYPTGTKIVENKKEKTS